MSSKKYVELLVLYFTLDIFNRAILIFSDCRCWSHWSRCCSPTQVQGLLCVVRRTVQFGGGLTDCCRSHHLLHRSLWMHWSMEGEPLLCDDRKYICSTEKREGRGWKMSQPQTERTCVTFTIVAWEGKKVTAHSPQRRIYTVLLYSFHWCCEDGVNRLELLPTIISFTIYLISIFSTKISSQNTSYAYRSSVVEVWQKYSVFCIYQFLSSKKNPPFCCIFIYIRWNYDVHDIRVKMTP